MDIYDSLFEAVRSEYDTLTLIKKSERGEVSLIRHRDCAGKKDMPSVVFSIMGASFYGCGASGCKTG